MILDVVLTDEAYRCAEAAYTSYAERSSTAAQSWWVALLGALDAIKQHPERFATARENDAFPVTLRQINFGGSRRRTHRIVYTVRPDRVVVYTVRHLAQRDLEPQDLSH